MQAPTCDPLRRRPRPLVHTKPLLPRAPETLVKTPLVRKFPRPSAPRHGGSGTRRQSRRREGKGSQEPSNHATQSPLTSSINSADRFPQTITNLLRVSSSCFLAMFTHPVSQSLSTRFLLLLLLLRLRLSKRLAAHLLVLTASSTSSSRSTRTRKAGKSRPHSSPSVYQLASRAVRVRAGGRAGGGRARGRCARRREEGGPRERQSGESLFSQTGSCHGQGRSPPCSFAVCSSGSAFGRRRARIMCR